MKSTIAKGLAGLALAASIGCTDYYFDGTIDDRKIVFAKGVKGSSDSTLQISTLKNEPVMNMKDIYSNDGQVDSVVLYRTAGSYQEFTCRLAQNQEVKDICGEAQRAWDHYTQRAYQADLDRLRQETQKISVPKPEEEPAGKKK